MTSKKISGAGRMQGRQTEQMSAEYVGLDTWPDERALAAMLEAQSRGVASVRAAFPEIAKAAALVADRIRRGGRLIYAGAGSSGLIAKLDAHELPATFGIPHSQALALIAGGTGSFDKIDNKMEDSAPQAVADLASVKAGPGDVVIGIAASGSTIYTCAALIEARRLGAATVGIACNDKAPIFDGADVAIRLLSGPEVLAGSTRMAAGSAQKAALNLLSTLAAIKLGHVYDGMMVNMRAENEKLRERAAHIVARAARIDLDLARAKLIEAKFEPKIAILLAAGASDGAHAAQLLQQEQGNLRRALACLGAAPPKA
jgi:N-acetylmuramic acid 6-phosphate etherase